MTFLEGGRSRIVSPQVLVRILDNARENTKVYMLQSRQQNGVCILKIILQLQSMSLKTEKLYGNMYNYFVNISGFAQGGEGTSVSMQLILKRTWVDCDPNQLKVILNIQGHKNVVS